MYRPGSAVTAPPFQQGAALTVSLVFLLVLTILGISSLRTTALEERMAGNQRDQQIAFQSAEAALYAAEDYVDDNVLSLGSFDSDGSDGLYAENVDHDGDGDASNEDGDDEFIWRYIDWSASGGSRSYDYPATGTDGGPASDPRYVIEHYGSVSSDTDELNLGNYGSGTGAGNVELFRITVRATGGSDNATVILQSTYGKRL